MAIDISGFGGGGGFIQLAPDLASPSTGDVTFKNITVGPFDCSSGLTEIFSLTGKFAVGALYLNGLTAETITVRLTVDGVVVWDDTFTASANPMLYVPSGIAGSYDLGLPFIVESSLSLEVQTATDTSIQLQYFARPIL